MISHATSELSSGPNCLVRLAFILRILRDGLRFSRISAVAFDRPWASPNDYSAVHVPRGLRGVRELQRSCQRPCTSDSIDNRRGRAIDLIPSPMAEGRPTAGSEAMQCCVAVATEDRTCVVSMGSPDVPNWAEHADIPWSTTWGYMERVVQASLGLPSHRTIVFDAGASSICAPRGRRDR